MNGSLSSLTTSQPGRTPRTNSKFGIRKPPPTRNERARLAYGHSLVTVGHRGRLVTAKPEGRSWKAASNRGKRFGEMGALKYSGQLETL